MYATTTSGHREHVKKSKDTRVVLSMLQTGVNAVIVQTVETTIETWVGLSYNDATSGNIFQAYETSTLNGVTRNHLGGAKLTMTQGSLTAWNTIEHCWGTKVSTQVSRMGDTNLYSVQRSTQVMTITNNNEGTMQLL